MRGMTVYGGLTCEVSSFCCYFFQEFVVLILAKEVYNMLLVALVSLSVCLFVCGQHYSKSYEWIGMKFYRGVLSSTRKN